MKYRRLSASQSVVQGRARSKKRMFKIVGRKGFLVGLVVLAAAPWIPGLPLVREPDSTELLP